MDVRPDTHSYDPLGRLSSETRVITGEAAVSVAENHRYFVVAPALGHQIELAVAIEISGGDSVGVGITQHRNRRTGRGSESAFAVAQQDGDGFVGAVGYRDVGLAVTIEVGDYHGGRPFAYRDLGDCRRVSWPLRLRRTTDERQNKRS